MVSPSDPDPSGSAAHDGEKQLKKEEEEEEEASAPEAMPATPKKPGLLKRVWTAIGLDPPTLIVMLKGSLPPVIALAMLRSKTVAAKYTTLGYLFAIMSLLGFAILPRAKFVQNTVLNIVRLCSAQPPHYAYQLIAMSIALRLYWRRHRSASMPSGRQC